MHTGVIASPRRKNEDRADAHAAMTQPHTHTIISAPKCLTPGGSGAQGATGLVAELAEKGKHNKYDHKLVEGVKMVPFAMDTTGVLGDEGYNLVVRLSQLAAINHPDIASAWRGKEVAYAGFLRAKWLQRITCVFFRYLGKMIANSFPRIALPGNFRGITNASVPTLLTTPSVSCRGF